MPDDPQHLSQRLLVEGQKTSDFFSNLSAEQWDLVVYTEGSKWSIRQILAHFVDAEDGLSTLVSDVLKGGGGAPEDFDINRYNERHVARMREIPVHDLLVQYRQLRERTAAIVSGMAPEDFDRRGRHPYLGVASLSDIIKLIYRHNQIHMRDIRRLTE